MNYFHLITIIATAEMYDFLSREALFLDSDYKAV